MIRKPAVMGTFYPSGLENINRFISSLDIKAIKKEESKINAFGLVSPHAGYIYSGKTAYMGFSEVELKNNIIIIGPNHTGMGVGFSVFPSGEFGFGDFTIPVNAKLALAIINQKESPFAADELAHLKEHSVEVQIPLIYSIKKTFNIVPIVVSYAGYPAIFSAAKAIYNALVKLDILKDTLIIASSDMTHYESAESAKSKDAIAIKEMLDLNPEGLYKKVLENDISMCGFIPAAIMLNIAKMAGCSDSKLIDYTNSGETSGDYSSVVGYASIAIY